MATTLIEDGLIVDGTGAAPFRGSVLIAGERIAAVIPHGSAAALPPADARVCAAGALIAPGFVDAHAHSDAYLILEPSAPSKLTQGITTEINGQCGGSASPRYGEARLSSDWASLLGDRLIWRSMAEYRAVFEAASPAVNSVQFVGHNTLRSSVVGYSPRPATEDEIRRMVHLLEKSLDEGGWGLTTGLIYQPGKYAQPEEVRALAKAAAAREGLYATHMRSEGDGLLSSIDEVIALARETGIRAIVSHLKTSGEKNWPKIDRALEKISGAVDAGFLLGSDRYPFCAAGTDLDVVLPDWAQAGAAPAECARLADPAQRARLVAALDAAPRDWSTVRIGGTWHAQTRACSGRTVDDLAAAGGETPGELVCRILEMDACRTGAFFHVMNEANLDKILACDWVLPGSDASLRAPWGPLGADHPHPRAYATMPVFYRRLRALGISREKAIARMTSAVAARFGLKDRGVLKKGAFADLVVLDESAFRGLATYAQPHRFSTGVVAVWVNGVLSLADGKLTPQRGGRFLTRGA